MVKNQTLFKSDLSFLYNKNVPPEPIINTNKKIINSLGELFPVKKVKYTITITNNSQRIKYFIFNFFIIIFKTDLPDIISLFPLFYLLSLSVQHQTDPRSF
jgi:DNA polymerase III alpha subunit (gram-positive type)